MPSPLGLTLSLVPLLAAIKGSTNISTSKGIHVQVGTLREEPVHHTSAPLSQNDCTRLLGEVQ